jgi:hypothetical protein
LRPRENLKCFGIPGNCLSRAKHSRGEDMPSLEAEEEKPKEEPKLDARKTARKGGYNIPVQMY